MLLEVCIGRSGRLEHVFQPRKMSHRGQMLSTESVLESVVVRDGGRLQLVASGWQGVAGA